MFVVRELLNKSVEFNKTGYLCFANMKIAFDGIQLSDGTGMCQKIGILNVIVKIIEDISIKIGIIIIKYGGGFSN